MLYQEPPETIEHMSDQAALPNLNADWVNAKGQFINGGDGNHPPIPETILPGARKANYF